LRARDAEFVGEVERYEDSYRLCYVRGPEGIIVELAEQIGRGLRPATNRLASVVPGQDPPTAPGSVQVVAGRAATRPAPGS